MTASDHLSGQQFTSVYHGTGRQAWEGGIQKEGLHPSVLDYTVTKKPSVARSFANDWDDPEMGNEGVVLHAKIPSHQFGDYVDEASHSDGEYRLKKTIPPHMLEER